MKPRSRAPFVGPLFALVLGVAPARAETTLYLLMKDGRLARVRGAGSEILRRIDGAEALATTPRGIAVLAHERVETLDGETWRVLPRGQGKELFAGPPPSAARRVPGTGRAFATDGKKLWAATREGLLWEVDLATGVRRDLGLGGWWSTIALAAVSGKVYAVTLAGKIWEIDPTAGTKTIVQMAGWESAIALAAR